MSGDPLGDFPSAEDVAEQLDCGRSPAECLDPAACWTNGKCMRRHAQMHPSDPKGGSRSIDRGAMRRKCLREKECRILDCGDPASDGHHIVYRSMGGDDVEDNLVPLCHHHHEILHFSAGEDYWWVRREIGKMLTDDEIRYVIHKLNYTTGTEFLERAYQMNDIRVRAFKLDIPLTDEGED